MPVAGMGRARSRLGRLARLRHDPRRAAVTGRPAPHTARPADHTAATELGTPRRNRHNTNGFRRDRIASPTQTSGTYLRPLLHRSWDATRPQFVEAMVFATDPSGRQPLPTGFPVDVAIVKQVWVVVTVSADNAAQCSLLSSTPKTAAKERRYTPSGRAASLDLM